MKILTVDDEGLALELLERRIREFLPDAEIAAKDDPEAAIAYLEENEPQIAFLDIHIGGIGGMQLAQICKERYPACNIVFCTGFSEYATDAFAVSASDYLMKPITSEKMKRALSNLRNPIKEEGEMPEFYVQCFGNFEVFYQGKPFSAMKNKSKELLAFLIDRNGAVCTNAEINENLWEEHSDVNLRMTRKSLLDELESIGKGDILIKGWGKLGVDKDKISCDYYDYLKGKPEAIAAYRGEYMSQYVWAGETANSISEHEKAE